MSEIVLLENNAMNTYVILLPGAQFEMESPLKFDEFVDHINEKLEKEGKISFKPEEGNSFTFYKSPYEHLPLGIMTKRCFLAKAAAQQFAARGHRG